MGRTRESKVRDPVIAFAHRQGVRTIRMYFGPGIQTGWPDDLFLISGGRPLFLEAKAPGEVPTKKQNLKMGMLEELGYDVAWYDDVQAAKDYILETLNGRKL